MTKEHFNPNRPILRFVGLSFKMRKCVSYHLALQAEAAFLEINSMNRFFTVKMSQVTVTATMVMMLTLTMTMWIRMMQWMMISRMDTKVMKIKRLN